MEANQLIPTAPPATNLPPLGRPQTMSTNGPAGGKKTFVLLLILIILIAAALITFYFIGQTAKVPPPASQILPVVEPTTAQAQTAPAAVTPSVEEELESVDVADDLTNEFQDVDADLQQL